MRHARLMLSLVLAGMLLPLGGRAASDNSVHQQTDAGSIKSGQSTTVGVVKKVDKDAGKVTISHGPIENLGMPQMTMVFRVKDPTIIEQLKEGDKIRFVADRVNGAFTVMSVESAK